MILLLRRPGGFACRGFAAAALFLLLGLGGQRVCGQDRPQIISSLGFSILPPAASSDASKATTSEHALRGFVGLAEGMRFRSTEELRQKLDSIRARLVNERVFASVEVEDRADGMLDGAAAHAIEIRVVEANTLSPLPDLSYDSNLGFQLGAQLGYGDALGSMMDLFLEGYAYFQPSSPNPVDEWDAHVKVANIMAGGLAWTWDSEFKSEYQDLFQGSEQLAYWKYYQVQCSLETKLDLGGLWYYDLAPGFDSHYGTVDLLGNGAYEGNYGGPNYRQALGWGRIDWTGDFRRGLELRLEHFVQVLGFSPSLGLENEVSATALYSQPWSCFDYFLRARVQTDWGRTPVDLGKYLRGIADDSMAGPSSAFLQQTVAIDLGLPRRVFDLQIQPFFDVGGALPENRGWNSSEDLREGAGADFVFFSDLLSGVFIRCTVGFDLGKENPLTSPEIDLDTTLSY